MADPLPILEQLPTLEQLNPSSKVKFDLVNGVVTATKDLVAGGNSLADLAAKVAAITAKLASTAWITSAMLSAGAVEAVHLNGQIVTTSLIDGAVTAFGDNIWSGSQTYNPGSAAWSTSTSPPSGVWAAGGSNPTPDVSALALNVNSANDPIKGHLLLDMQLYDFVTGSEVWIQIVNDLGEVVAGPSKVDIAYSANYTSININQAGGPFKFSDTAGDRVYTAQVAAYCPSSVSTAVTVTRAQLHLMDHKK